jgi:alkylhydroperoxidase family enzyme
VLEDWRTAPVDERIRGTLGFLEKLTLTPGEIGPADIRVARAAGASDEALEDAILVCGAFNVLDRVADALAWESRAAIATITRGAAASLKYGYTLRGLLHSRR